MMNNILSYTGRCHKRTAFWYYTQLVFSQTDFIAAAKRLHNRKAG